VKHILQMHQGTLAIESRLREGTTVTVWLPAPH
jgi:signal transduction histidine kinase